MMEEVASLERKVEESKKAVEAKKKKIPGGENHEQLEIEGADNVAFEGTPGSVAKHGVAVDCNDVQCNLSTKSGRQSVKSGRSSAGTCKASRQSASRSSQRSECSKKGEKACTLNTVSEQVTIAETSLTRVGLLSHSRVLGQT